MALCLTCSKSNGLHSKSTKHATWLAENNRHSAIPPNAPPPTTKPFVPKHSSVRIRVTIGGPDRNVLFWAAQPRAISSAIPNAPQAYGSYPNMGIGKVRNGVLTLSCQAPRPYREEGKTWPCHVHYVNPQNDLKHWIPKVFAVAAFPGHHDHNQTYYSMTCINHTDPKCSIVTPSRLWSNWNRFIVVNALPEKYPSIHKPNGKMALHVPYNAPNKVIKDASQVLGDHPYVVYCMHGKCHAASVLIRRLMNTKSAKNVYYMPSGQVGWSRLMNKNFKHV